MKEGLHEVILSFGFKAVPKHPDPRLGGGLVKSTRIQGTKPFSALAIGSLHKGCSRSGALKRQPLPRRHASVRRSGRCEARVLMMHVIWEFHQGPQYRPQNSRALIIRTPINRTPNLTVIYAHFSMYKHESNVKSACSSWRTTLRNLASFLGCSDPSAG